MARYQYRIICQYSGNDDSFALNAAGADGWELVAVSDRSFGGRALYMKRAVDETQQLRSDIERIGRERDQMVAANVELQERLSKLEDDLK